MVTNNIRNILRQLETLADGWAMAGEIPAIERDLALEKLRALYDVLLKPAGAVPAIAEPEQEYDPVSINIDDVLSVDGDDPFAGPELQPVAEAAPPVRLEPVMQPEPQPVPEIEIRPEPESAAQPEPVIQPQPEVAAQPAAEPAAQPRSAVPKSQPEVPIPTLFGADESEELFRHRHKRQVLMSLYDIEDTAPASPQRGSAAEPEAEPIVESQVKTRPMQLEKPTRSEQSEQSAAGRKPVFEPHPVSIPQPLVEPEEEDDLVIEEIDLSVEEELPVQNVAQEEAVEPRFTISRVGREEYEPETTSGKHDMPAEKGDVLGDVLNPHKQTLADSLASSHSAEGRADDLRKMIGLNDRFLLIRDLFNGDAAACDRTIGELNTFADLDDCMIYIAENHTWNPNSDGAKLLMELLQRKLS